MGPKVLALIESNIAMRYTLDARLTPLGFRLTILTTPAAFERRLASETFDWIILDAATVEPHQRRFLERLGGRRKGARIVWCGKPPRNAPVWIEAVFEKPLRYGDVARFFSRWALPEQPEAPTSDVCMDVGTEAAPDALAKRDETPPRGGSHD